MHRHSKTATAPTSDAAGCTSDAAACASVPCPFFFSISHLAPSRCRLGPIHANSDHIDQYRAKSPIQAEIPKKKGCKTHRFNLITNPKLSQFSKLTYAPFFTSIFNSLSLSVLCLPSWPWIMHPAGEKEDDLSGTQVVAFYHYLDPCLTHHSIFLSITMNYDWSINGFFFFFTWTWKSPTISPSSLIL